MAAYLGPSSPVKSVKIPTTFQISRLPFPAFRLSRKSHSHVSATLVTYVFIAVLSLECFVLRTKVLKSVSFINF